MTTRKQVKMETECGWQPTGTIKEKREYKVNGINRGKCFRCRVTNFFRTHHPIMYCIEGVTRHRDNQNAG